MRLAPALLASSALLAGVAPRPVCAEEALGPPRMLVARVEAGGEGRAPELMDAIARRLEAAGLEVRLPAPAPSMPDFAASLDRARRAYRGLAPTEARAEAESILEGASRLGGGLSRSMLVDALLLVALSAQAVGDADGAAAALDRVLMVDPSIELDPGAYSPTIRDLLEARRAGASALEGASLVLEGLPGGAVVEIDGAAVDPRAGAFSLPAGSHLVRVTAEGRRPWGRRLDLPSGGTSVEVELPPDPDARLRAPGPPGSDATELASASRSLSCSLVLIDVVDGDDGEVVEAWDEETDARASARPEGRDAADVAEHLVSDLLAETFVEPDGGAPSPPVPGRPPDRLPWILAGAGAALAVAVGVVLAVVLTLPDDGGGDWEARWAR